MNNYEKIADAWPPACCVAAFIAEALRQFGHPILNRRTLAKQLGIRVGPNKENPWHLTEESDPDLQGLLVSDAKKLMPKILKQYDKNLGFRHIPFRTVAFGLFEEVLNHALKQGCLVAVGFNKAMLFSEEGIIRHVARITTVNDGLKVLILDDTYGVPARQTIVEWRYLEEAVYSVDDGFWIIGRTDQLEFN